MCPEIKVKYFQTNVKEVLYTPSNGVDGVGGDDNTATAITYIYTDVVVVIVDDIVRYFSKTKSLLLALGFSFNHIIQYTCSK